MIIDLDPEAFEDICETLSRRHHIVRLADTQKLSNGTVSASYEFVHVLYREVCYRRIPPARRVKLHRRLAEWVEAQLERSNMPAAWLVGHFEQGGDWLRAIKYLCLSADTAGRRFEPRQAAEILQHALELVSKLPEAERTRAILDVAGTQRGFITHAQLLECGLDRKAIKRRRESGWFRPHLRGASGHLARRPAGGFLDPPAEGLLQRHRPDLRGLFHRPGALGRAQSLELSARRTRSYGSA